MDPMSANCHLPPMTGDGSGTRTADVYRVTAAGHVEVLFASNTSF